MKKKKTTSTKHRIPRIGFGKNWRLRAEVVQAKAENAPLPSQLRDAVFREDMRLRDLRVPFLQVEDCQVVGKLGDLHQHHLTVSASDYLTVGDFRKFFRALRLLLDNATDEMIEHAMGGIDEPPPSDGAL